jgi:hypothetical protein
MARYKAVFIDRMLQNTRVSRNRGRWSPKLRSYIFGALKKRRATLVFQTPKIIARAAIKSRTPLSTQPARA